MVQHIIVALVVLVAAVYVARKYLPAAWRQKLVYALTRRGAEQSKLVRWLDADASCGSGCDSCKACEDTPPAPPQDGKHRVIPLRIKR